MRIKIYEITDSTHVTHWIAAANHERAKAAIESMTNIWLTPNHSAT